MFGQYDGLIISELPDAQTAAALSRAVTGSGAFSRFETHELIKASDLAQIAKRAKQISYQPQAPDKQCPPCPLALPAPPQFGCADLAPRNQQPPAIRPLLERAECRVRARSRRPIRRPGNRA